MVLELPLRAGWRDREPPLFCPRGVMKGGVTAVGTDARAAGADVVIDLRDLAEEGAGEGLVGATVASFGRIDQIISNAGFADKRRAGYFDLQDYRASNATM